MSNNFTGHLENNNSILLKKEVALLLVFLNELIISSENKVVYRDENLKTQKFKSAGGCSFWDTVYAVGAGLNKSSAAANFRYNLTEDLTENGLGDCTPLGSPEYHDIGVVHYYTMAWCCD